MFKTTDGKSWSRTNEGIGDSTGSSVFGLALAGSARPRLYAVSGCWDDDLCDQTGIYTSTDGAATWLTRLVIDSPGYRFQALATHSSSDLVVFAGHATNGVYLTTDGGVTWALFNDGLTDPHIFAIATAPSAPNTAYAATSSGEVFKYEG